MEEDPDVPGGGRAAEDRRRAIKEVRRPPLAPHHMSVSSHAVPHTTLDMDASLIWRTYDHVLQVYGIITSCRWPGAPSSGNVSQGVHAMQDLADDLADAPPPEPRPTSDQLPPIPIKVCLLLLVQKQYTFPHLSPARVPGLVAWRVLDDLLRMQWVTRSSK